MAKSISISLEENTSSVALDFQSLQAYLPVTALDAINIEILAIDGKDLARRQRLGSKIIVRASS